MPAKRRLLLQSLPAGQRGLGLLETVAALGLVVGAVVFFLAALAFHSMASRSVDANSQALKLVSSTLETIKAAPYGTTYSVTAQLPPKVSTLPEIAVTITATEGQTVTASDPNSEFTLAITVTLEQANLQRVTANTSRLATSYLSVQMYKAKLA